ncbi:hypothetical protein V498_01626 [Pseudogymnoascus sp. VKM F-4517 (FW-2822)]|nr:hypothetical protein V498_01626 [Pseudogymnoascus sp. VKM F-4517 (FW-2822)]
MPVTQSGNKLTEIMAHNLKGEQSAGHHPVMPSIFCCKVPPRPSNVSIMSIDTPELTRLETLPTEILYSVIDHLPVRQIKNLSCASKRLRQACLSTLFRHVKFEFSPAGIEGLNDLLKSNICGSIASFTYEITELLKPEILDFDRFRSDILTADSHVDQAKDLYDAGYEADEFHSYMAIYKTVHGICREQRSIVDEGADLILSSVFCALPLLQEVRLSFSEVLEDDGWLLIPDMVINYEFYKHHLQVVSSAIQRARSTGVAIHTISLLHFDLPFYDSGEEPNLGPLSESLRQLLKDVKVLRVRGVSKRVLELLSHCAFDLHQFDMCGVAAPEKVIKDFFETNKKSIRSIGFHDVGILGISGLNCLYSKTPLSASMLCRVEMLTFRNEKQRLRYLRCTSSGPIILQDPRNGNISGTSTSDLESLEKEMERLRLQAQVTPKATATTMAHRRMLLSHRECTYSMYYNGEKLASHIHSQLGLTILLTNVKLITKPGDLYQWSISTARKAALFNKQLTKHSTGSYIDLCNGVGVHFKAVLGKGAADYEPETRLVTKITAFDAPEKSREHPSSNTIAKEWREKFNAEVAIREALEIKMMEIKGENAELLTEMEALREEEAMRIQELEKAREVLLITSRILQERALKASEDSQKITHAATSDLKGTAGEAKTVRLSRLGRLKVLLVWIIQSPEHLEWMRPWMTSTKEIQSPSATVQMFPGRPNMDTLIDMEIESQIGAMGVSVCGSGSLSDDVRNVCAGGRLEMHLILRYSYRAIVLRTRETEMGRDRRAGIGWKDPKPGPGRSWMVLGSTPPDPKARRSLFVAYSIACVVAQLGNMSNVLGVSAVGTIGGLNSNNQTSAGASAPSASTGAVIAIVAGGIGALFFSIVMVGVIIAVQRHGHPVRRNPQQVRPGRPKGPKRLALAMLESIPIVKFGHSNEDIELADTDRANRNQWTTTDAIDTSTIHPARTVNPVPALMCGSLQARSSGHECSICLNVFIEDEDIRILLCNHKFHAVCIDPWLLNISGTCPLCRVDLRHTTDNSDTGTNAASDSLLPPLPNEVGDAAPHRSHRPSFDELRSAARSGPEECIAALRRLYHENHHASHASIHTEATAPRESRLRLGTDGFTRQVYLINGQQPAPLIDISEGDDLEVFVQNDLPVASTIHWHGLLQRGTPYMDGVLGVSQYPIPPVATLPTSSALTTTMQSACLKH